ncbi:MAG: aminotransferase [Woeseiaceae bacterium]|nr:aminotransferase [Woeseiaceae bacterium]
MKPAIDLDTRELQEKDREHFLHPWHDFESDPERLVVTRAEGARIYDSDGNAYLDGIGGMWCVNVGYGRSEIAEVMARQGELMPYYSTFTDTTNVPAVQLSAKLAELAPGSINNVMYSCSGSAANDSAVRLAHYYHARRGMPGKKHIITRRSAYHGSTYLGISLSGRDYRNPGHVHFVDDIVQHLSAPNTYRRPDDLSLEAFRDQLVAEFESKIQELGADNIAAFIAEPIMGAGGVIVPPPGYLQEMRELCRKNDILYISDEVVTAFGRLGHMFSSLDEFGIQPDMIVAAKGITSGYIPLGATLFSDEIIDVISEPDEGACFEHGFTYSGHPVACAVALKNIEILESESICEHVRDVGDYFEQQLRTLVDLPYVGDVRGRRFMMCVEYVADKKTKAQLPWELDISRRISDACEERGLMVRPLGHLDVLSPPLVLTRSDIDELVRILGDSIEAVAPDIRAALN